ncbi:hypothetical protein ADEAN_000362700 [Angomonas deanei]|uniref:Uncharacterized protein n=1 Tax=Angomonas deanei TaxID=59799 RepID=A0A7G2C8Q2_9TRYP|nr:hypothetical protein ADEAN_000362700 [Angomonas deanei]
MTAHAVVLLPSPGHHPQCPFPEKTTERTTPLRHTLAVSCGGNEDLRIGNSNALEANSLGEPIGLIYLLRRRPISFSEAIRVFMHKNKIPLTVTATPERDAILDELF